MGGFVDFDLIGTSKTVPGAKVLISKLYEDYNPENIIVSNRDEVDRCYEQDDYLPRFLIEETEVSD